MARNSGAQISRKKRPPNQMRRKRAFPQTCRRTRRTFARKSWFRDKINRSDFSNYLEPLPYPNALEALAAASWTRGAIRSKSPSRLNRTEGPTTAMAATPAPV